MKNKARIAHQNVYNICTIITSSALYERQHINILSLGLPAIAFTHSADAFQNISQELNGIRKQPE